MQCFHTENFFFFFFLVIVFYSSHTVVLGRLCICFCFFIIISCCSGNWMPNAMQCFHRKNLYYLFLFLHHHQLLFWKFRMPTMQCFHTEEFIVFCFLFLHHQLLIVLEIQDVLWCFHTCCIYVVFLFCFFIISCCCSGNSGCPMLCSAFTQEENRPKWWIAVDEWM